ncbi:MAG: hypothetical protein WD042_04730 [Phycisphaeraceae bacterium]
MSDTSLTTDEKRPDIAEKVRFWEEQDKINQAIIPRVIEIHEALRDLHTRTADISSQIAAAEARVIQRVQKQLQTVRLIAYTALALSGIACAFAVYQLLT